MRITKEQRRALWNLWRGDFPSAAFKADNPEAIFHPGCGAYRKFRRSASVEGFCGDYWVAVQWSGMYIGIEKDGYTHS